MAKVEYVKLKRSKPGRKPGSVTSKRVKDAQGKANTVYTVNADSRTFGTDLEYVFGQNVRRARQEYKKRFGSADRVRKGG
jgi:hypothetical protein